MFYKNVAHWQRWKFINKLHTTWDPLRFERHSLLRLGQSRVYFSLSIVLFESTECNIASTSPTFFEFQIKSIYSAIKTDQTGFCSLGVFPIIFTSSRWTTMPIIHGLGWNEGKEGS